VFVFISLMTLLVNQIIWNDEAISGVTWSTMSAFFLYVLSKIMEIVGIADLGAEI
jgi:hypothetical protein